MMQHTAPVIMIVWDFDDPRLSSTHLFNSVDDAKEACRQTWPDCVFEFVPHLNVEIAVNEKDYGLMATIRPLSVLPAAALATHASYVGKEND